MRRCCRFNLLKSISRVDDDFFQQSRKILFVVAFTTGWFGVLYVLYNIYSIVVEPTGANLAVLLGSICLTTALLIGYSTARFTRRAPDYIVETIALLFNIGFLILVVSAENLPYGPLFLSVAMGLVMMRCPRYWLHLPVCLLGWVLTTYEQSFVPLGYPRLVIVGTTMYTLGDVFLRGITVLFSMFIAMMALHMQTSEFRRILAASETALRMSFEVAEKLAAYDTTGSTELLEHYLDEGVADTELVETFARITSNLEAYRAFIPPALLEGGTGGDDVGATFSHTVSGRDEDTVTMETPVVSIAEEQKYASALNSKLLNVPVSDEVKSLHSSASALPSPINRSKNRLSLSVSMMEDPRVARLRAMGFKKYHVSLLGISCAVPAPEQMPHEIHSYCQNLISTTVSVIEQCDGVVMQMMADQMYISWNAFKPSQLHQLSATRAAHALLVQYCEDDTRKDSVHIAVATGRALAGFIGTTTIKSPVIYGDVVDQTKLLLAYARQVASPVVVTDGVYRKVVSQFNCSPVDILAFGPDKEKSEKIYELYTSAVEMPKSEFDHLNEPYMQGFSKFISNAYGESLPYFAEFLKRGHTAAYRRHLQSALRISRLCAYFRSDKCVRHDVPTPYSRNLIEWDNYEAGSLNVPMPSEVGNNPSLAPLVVTTTQTNNNEPSSSGSMSPRNLTSPKLTSPKEVNLRDQVAAARAGNSTATTEYGGSGTFTPSEVESTDQRNNNTTMDDGRKFTAVDGMMYHRSDKILGKGATAEVYLGMQGDGSLVALKYVKINALNDDGAGKNNRRTKKKDDMEEVLQEVEMLQGLRHDDIVAYLGAAIVNKHLVIITEYVSGGSLSSALESFGRIPEVSLRRYLSDILRGLDYLHNHGIVHRDIKPHNVLLMIDGQCKLTDFGAAALLSKGSGTQVTGTPLYMAPEACRGQATKASDIWGIGIMTIELLTGHLPWTPAQRGTPFIAPQFIFRLGRDETLIPVIPDDIVGPAREFCAWCLSRNQEERPTADQLLRHQYLL